MEWVEAKRTREKTRADPEPARGRMEAERAVVIFPAGRLARRRRDGALTDPPWAPAAASLARKHEAPVVPIHVAGPWSTLFHFFDRFSQELRDITLFHELLNKRGGAFRLTVGPLIPPGRLAGDAAEATYALKAYVERVLPADPDAGSHDPAPPEIELATPEADRAAGRGDRAPARAPARRSAAGPLGAGKSTLARGLVRALTTPGRGGAQPHLHPGAVLRGAGVPARPLRPLSPVAAGRGVRARPRRGAGGRARR